MKVTEDAKGDVTRIYLDGRFDAHTCGMVEPHIREKIENGRYHIVLDLENVPFIASAGLRIILVYARELRQKYEGDLHISGVQPNVRKVFEISGLNSVLQIFDDVESATGGFQPAS